MPLTNEQIEEISGKYQKAKDDMAKQLHAAWGQEIVWRTDVVLLFAELCRRLPEPQPANPEQAEHNSKAKRA